MTANIAKQNTDVNRSLVMNINAVLHEAVDEEHGPATGQSEVAGHT